MRESLFQRGRMIFSIAVVGILAWGSAPALMAQTGRRAAHTYSVASLKGDYAVINHYGANLALGIGDERFDGTGNATGSLLLNRPTATGSRELLGQRLLGDAVRFPEGGATTWRAV
jgi:hypothetical protein